MIRDCGWVQMAGLYAAKVLRCVKCQQLTSFSPWGALFYVTVCLVRRIYENRLKLAAMVTIFVCSGGHQHMVDF
jgi:hypothetical protein